jgi:nucleotide-binding universal stress UspA family protein
MSLYTIRNIVVPVDLSETSLNALQTAASLAQLHDAALHVLHVIEDFQKLLDDFQGSSYRYASNTNDVLSALVNGIQSEGQSRLSLLQEEGPVPELVIRHSLKVQADLIVLGSHGASGFREGFIGTNAYSIMKYAPCPALLIPPGKTHFEFRKALYPVRPINGALMRFDIARSLLSGTAELDVLGLSSLKMERNTSVLDKMIAEVRQKTGDQKTLFRSSWSGDRNISEEVLHFIQSKMTDLVILTPVLDATIKPNFIGPHMQRIMNCSRVPVLNIKKVPATFPHLAPSS